MIHIIPFSKSTIDLTLKSNSILRHIFNAQYTIPFDACFGNRTKLPDDDEKNWLCFVYREHQIQISGNS